MAACTGASEKDREGIGPEAEKHVTEAKREEPHPAVCGRLAGQTCPDKYRDPGRHCPQQDQLPTDAPTRERSYRPELEGDLRPD